MARTKREIITDDEACTALAGDIAADAMTRILDLLATRDFPPQRVLIAVSEALHDAHRTFCEIPTLVAAESYPELRAAVASERRNLVEGSRLAATEMCLDLEAEEGLDDEPFALPPPAIGQA